MKKQINQPYNNNGVHVIVSLRRGVAMAISKDENYKSAFRPLKGTSIDGFETNNLSSKRIELIQKDLFLDYTSNHKQMTEEEKKQIMKRIKKNIDTTIYSLLGDYDIQNFTKSNKQSQYVEAMLKPIKRKSNESNKEYKIREKITRKKFLDKQGIELEYTLNSIKGRNCNFIDTLNIIKNIIKSKDFAKVMLFGRIINNKPKTNINKNNKRPQKVDKPITNKYKANNNMKNKIKSKKLVQKVIENRKKIKQKEKRKINNKKTKTRRYTAPNGLLKSLKEKTKNPQFTKKVVSGLAAAGIMGLSIAGIWYANQTKRNTDVEIKTNNIETTIKKPENKLELDHIENMIDIQNEQLQELKEVEQSRINEEQIVLNDMLIECLDLRIGNEFNMKDGKYYEGPDGGKSGNYEGKSSKVKINYIDVIEDGNYKQYTINDNKTISQIKKEHPNARISYHVITEDGMTLGWNESTENDIEKNMVKSALMNIKPYISKDTMKFLCDNDLMSLVDKNQCEKYISNLQSAMEKYSKTMQVEER